MEASILDLRRKTREVLKALERRENVTILHRGRKKGTIIPVGASEKPESLSEHPAFGMWKDRGDFKDVAKAVREIRKGRGHAV